MNNYTQVKRWLTAGYRAIFGRRGNGPNGFGSEGSECPRAFAPLYRRQVIVGGRQVRCAVDYLTPAPTQV